MLVLSTGVFFYHLGIMSTGFLSTRDFVNWRFYPHGVLSTGILSVAVLSKGGFVQWGLVH